MAANCSPRAQELQTLRGHQPAHTPSPPRLAPGVQCVRFAHLYLCHYTV